MVIFDKIHHSRPIFVTLSLLFAIGTIGGFFIIRTQQQAFIDQYYDSGISLARSVISFLEHTMKEAEGRHELQQTLVEITGTGTTSEVTVISRDMRVYASSDSSKVGAIIENPAIASLMTTGGSRIHQEESGVTGILVNLENKPSCQVCHGTATTSLGVVEIHMASQELNRHLFEQTLALATIGGSTLLVVALSMYLILRNVFIRPFSKRINDLINEHTNMDRLYATDRLASIGELASGIAHELNNPLTSVVGFSDLILQQKGLTDSIRDDLKIVNSEAQRAGQIVKNLLTFARGRPSEKKPIDINSSIEKILEMRAYEQRANNISIDKNLAPDLPEIMGDFFQLQQVFLNLVINAEYFMIEANKGGTLNVSTEARDGMVRTTIADDGPGIPPDNIKRLFDPFFTTKEVGKGTGLGLSIVHGIVTGHGGTITAESEPGEGATFIIDLPTAESQLPDEVSQQSRDPA